MPAKPSPVIDTVVRTFENTDQFDLLDFSLRLNAFVATEHYFVDGGLVISLNGPFGAGKTTFLDMWRNDLLERREQDTTLPLRILLNAWENDYCGDPLLSVVSALSDALTRSGNDTLRVKSVKLREAAKDAAWYTIGLAGGIASHLSGVDPIAAGEFAERKKRGRKPTAIKKGDLLAAYEERTSSLKSLKKALIDTFSGEQPKALVMIDELDRCRPSYAIDYLETVKHFFDVHGLAFVLTVDKAQLRSSAKALFGLDLNFDEYYRKFVHRNVELPFPSEQGIRKLAEHYEGTILEVSRKEFTRSSSLNIRDRFEDIGEIATGLRLTPRQIHEVFRLIGHALECPPEKRGKLLWCYGAASILLAALSVGSPEIYHRIGRGLATTDDLLTIVKLFENDRHRKWWGSIMLTGYSTGNKERDKALHQEFIRAGILPEETAEENNRSLSQFALGWGMHSTVRGIRHTYDVIEGIKTFSTK